VSGVRPCLLWLGVSFILAGCANVTERPADLGTPEIATPPRTGSGIVEIARKYVGAPYRWGGSSPSGFDCSGLVRYVYAQVGVELPHNAAKQYALGAPVAREDLLPGDIVFFDRLRHNGIYIGDGRFIHARQTGKRVSIAGLDEAWYAERWVGARRIEPLQPAGDDQER
jgi:cell wall-associated NlpC family hydrolase